MTIESWAPRPPRVPCALVLDITRAMPSDAMPALNDGLRALRAALYADPDTRDVVELTVATCGRRAETVRPFASPAQWHLPTLYADGATPLDDALECAMDEIARRTGQYRDTGTPHRRPWRVALRALAPEPTRVRLASADEIPALLAAIGHGLRRAAVA